MRRFELIAARIIFVVLMASLAGMSLLLVAMVAMSLFSPSSLESGCTR